MFNSEELKNKIKENKALLDKQGSNSGNRDSFFKVTYLPEGIHKVRLIPDINSEVSVEMYVHKLEGTGKLFACGRQHRTDSDDNCPVCKALAQAKEQNVSFDYKWGRTLKSKCLIYLASTTAKQDENWKVGTFYILCSNSFLHKGVTEGLATLVEASNAEPARSEEIFKILDVTADNQPAFVIQHKAGKEGSTTVMPDAYTKLPALQIPEGELPNLKEVYIDQTKLNEDLVNKQLEAINRRVNNIAVSTSVATQQVAPSAQAQQVPQPQQVAQPQVQQYAQPQAQPQMQQPVQPQVQTVPQPTQLNGAVPPPPPMGNFNVTEPNQIG